MKSVVINKTQVRISRSLIESWKQSVIERLKKRKVLIPKTVTELVIVAVTNSEMKKLNAHYRGKDYATDVLSFVSGDPTSLGELVICPAVLKKQAQEHELTFKEELGYML